MNVLLISAHRLVGLKASRGTFPVAMLHLAAALREAEHRPLLCDLSTLRVGDGVCGNEVYWSALKERIDAGGVGAVAFNCFSSMHFPVVREMARRVRSYDRGLPILLGGSHPTYFPREILLNCPEFDFEPIGEGEEQIVALADAISAQQRSRSAAIQALAYRDGTGAVRVNPRTHYLDRLATLPLPAYDLLNFSDYYSAHTNWYNPKGFEIRLAVPILTSRSCPFSCTFCSAHTMMGRRHRLRDPRRVVDEIELLVRDHGQNYFSFVDDNVNLNRGHFIEICSGIHQRGLDIQLCVPQGLCLNAVDREMIQAFVDAGGVTVSLPIESGSDYIRNQVARKNLTLETILSVAQLIKEFGLFSVGLFIMGFAEETVETLEETAALIERLTLDVNAVSTIVPFPGTEVYAQAKREGLLLFDDSELWGGNVFFDPQNKQEFFIRPRHLVLADLHRFRARFNALYIYSDRAKALNS